MNVGPERTPGSGTTGSARGDRASASSPIALMRMRAPGVSVTSMKPSRALALSRSAATSAPAISISSVSPFSRDQVASPTRAPSEPPGCAQGSCTLPLSIRMVHVALR